MPPILATAISRWTASGISNTEANLLNSVTVSVVDLPTGMLGETVDNRVYVDITAAGLGWFVDSTPNDDFEFDIAVSTTERVASAGSPAASGIDLLTVLMHELGHVLGFADVTTDSTGPLMSASLLQGTRRLPNNDAFNILQTFSALDTNHDGIISPIDALLIINQLNIRSLISTQLSNAIPAGLDTNGDGILSPIDCLLVINYLNQRQANAGGPANAEGEGSTAFDQQSTSLATPSVQADVDNDLISTLAADGWINGRRKSLSNS